jgi:hypothetical protein
MEREPRRRALAWPTSRPGLECVVRARSIRVCPAEQARWLGYDRITSQIMGRIGDLTDRQDAGAGQSG